MMNVQKLNKETESPFALAHKYYQIMSVLNDLKLAEGEIQFIAFSAVRGNMADPELRDEFCKLYDTTPATINNIVYRLKKSDRKNIIIKKNKKIFVNPILTQVDFTQPLALLISLTLVTKNNVEPTLVSPKEQQKSNEEGAEVITQNDSTLNVKKYG